MGLVDEADEVLREVVEQAVRPVAGVAAVEDPRIVLDPGAEAQLAEHLHVVLGALAKPVGLEQLALCLELGAARVQLATDLRHGVLDVALPHVVVRRRPDPDVLEVILDHLAGQRVEVLQVLDLVAEQHDPVGGLGVGREDLERLAAHPECPARERGVVARVLDRDQLPQQRIAVDELTLAQRLQVLVVGLRRTQPVDAGHAGHDQDIPAREQRRRRRVAQAVDLLVDRRVLLDVEVPAGDVRLGLVVVVVGDEVLDRVTREVGPELVAELRRQRLVVGDHERRLLHPLDRRRHRHRLARTGGAEQRRELLAGVHALRQRVDRGRLIGGRTVGGIELELRHGRTFKRSGRTGWNWVGAAWRARTLMGSARSLARAP